MLQPRRDRAGHIAQPESDKTKAICPNQNRGLRGHTQGGKPGFGVAWRFRSATQIQPKAHEGGSNPSRLAMILSVIRFGSTASIRCRIGSGVSW